MTARQDYPALMAYIDSRNAVKTDSHWCTQLCEDEAEAQTGAFAAVAAELARAKADYAASRKPGASIFPCNRDMGEFLGLPLSANGEPAHGYYMAGGVTDHHELGVALRKAELLIAAGRPLRVVAARSKADRKPCRFYVFTGADQIKIEGTSAVASDGKRRVRLSSNWSIQTALVALATALDTGRYYGEPAA